MQTGVPTNKKIGVRAFPRPLEASALLRPAQKLVGKGQLGLPMCLLDPLLCFNVKFKQSESQRRACNHYYGLAKGKPLLIPMGLEYKMNHKALKAKQTHEIREECHSTAGIE